MSEPTINVPTRTGRDHPCPVCGSRDVARFSYGMPDFTDDLRVALNTGELRLGGCMVWSDMPQYACNACRHKWRAEHKVEVADDLTDR